MYGSVELLTLKYIQIMNLSTQKKKNIRLRSCFFTVVVAMLFICEFPLNGGIALAQVSSSKGVTGQVVDSQGDPIIGASVIVVGTNIGAITDLNGKFAISATKDAKIEISFIGYETQRLHVENRTFIKVVLQEEVKKVDDVVVVAYATQKKVSVVGAISSVKGDEVLKAPTGDVATALTGRLPGLTTV